MSRFQKVILAALAWCLFLGGAWAWCWWARNYNTWISARPDASFWWGSIAAFFTQIVTLVAAIAATVAAFNHEGAEHED